MFSHDQDLNRTAMGQLCFRQGLSNNQGRPEALVIFFEL